MHTVLSEADFIARARAFLRDELGRDCDHIAPDADLIASGILSSLPLLSFLHFIERTRERELEGAPELERGFSLRTAYELALK